MEKLIKLRFLEIYENKMKPEVQVDTKQNGLESTRVYAPFDKALEALTERGHDVISLEQNAQLRIQQGKYAYISRNGNWTREGIIHVPGKGAFLTKNSPIMENPAEATQAQREGIGLDYFLSAEQVEQSLQDSVKVSTKKIPTKMFGEDEITIYAFGDVAEKYGNFLNESGIKAMLVEIASLEDKPFARQMRFVSLDVDSRLIDVSDLFYDGWLRGVKELNKSQSDKEK